MSRALLPAAAALVLLPGTAAAQMLNDMLYSDHVDPVRFHGIRREARLQGEQLVLSLDLFTYRNESSNDVVVAIHANNGAGRIQLKYIRSSRSSNRSYQLAAGRILSSSTQLNERLGSRTLQSSGMPEMSAQSDGLASADDYIPLSSSAHQQAWV